jgi:hypothetical protein
VVDNTRRRLSFFVMVLAFSRRMYVEFTASQTMEHFLACHGDNTETAHAVPAGTVALCGCESSSGWLWARGFDVTCEGCWQKQLEEELEKDVLVIWMRSMNILVTRQSWIDMAWPGDAIPIRLSTRACCLGRYKTGRCLTKTGTRSNREG